MTTGLDNGLRAADAPGWLVRLGVRSWLLLGVFAAAAVAVVALSSVSAVIMPILLAAVLGVLFRPLVDRGERHGLPRGAGSALVLVAVLAVIVALAVVSARTLAAQAPEIARLARQGGETALGWFVGRGQSEPDAGAMAAAARRALPALGGGLWNALAGITWSIVGFLIGAFFALFTLFFALRDGHKLNRWLEERLGLASIHGAAVIEDAEAAVRSYFAGTGLTALVTAPIVVIPMALLGLPLLLPVSIVYLVTSFVPYVGAWVGGAFAILVALGSGGVDAAVIVTIAVVVSNGSVQSVVASWAVGKRLRMHPVIVLAATAVAGIIGGLTLMILAAPVTATVIATARRIRAAKEATGARDPAASEQGLPQADTAGSSVRAD